MRSKLAAALSRCRWNSFCSSSSSESVKPSICTSSVRAVDTARISSSSLSCMTLASRFWGVLNKKDDQKCAYRGARVDDKLPRIGVMEIGTGRGPNYVDENSEQKGQRRPHCVGGC